MSSIESNPAEPLIEPLTRREREILALLAQGYSGPEIAERLTLAVSSVKWHTQHLYGKLGVNSKRQALTRAKELGLLGMSLPTALPESPPTPSAPHIPKHNLPLQVTRFFGCEHEIAQVKERLAEWRLVTLTGSGGVGKTRLSLRVAEEVIEDYSSGVWFVELAPLSDPALVPQQVAASLGLRDEPGHPVLETLTSFLRERQALLVLNNCEHLVEACAQLADGLLHVCPRLQLLASSREPLGIAGEAVFHVPSLPFPDPSHLPAIESLNDYTALSLFVDRARAVRPDYQVTPQNAPSVARICQRLDGIPLALELAAARLRLLNTETLAARLDDAFGLLTGGSRTALPRHQTLWATMDWSYNLLSEAERRLLQRLSVFARGCTLEAAEAVCSSPMSRLGRGAGGEGLDVLDLLTQLVNKSLVVVEREQGAEARYRLLETVRQYAWEKLAETGEGNRVRAQHLAYYLQFAEDAEPHLFRAEQLDWLARLEREHDNLRVALEWALNGEGDDAPGPPEAGLRLANALWRFWYVRGYWQEGREWLGRGLAAIGQPSRTVARARALIRATFFADDQKQRVRLVDESLALCRELGDKPGIAFALRLKFESVMGDYSSARLLLEESLTLYRELGDKWGIAAVLSYFGITAQGEHNLPAARHFYEESLKLHREMGDRRGMGWVLGYMGNLAFKQRDWSAARALYEESLSLARELGDKVGMVDRLSDLGRVALEQGDYLQAGKLLEQGLAIARELGYKNTLDMLFNLERMARFRDDYGQAVKLFEEGLTISRETGNKWGIAWALCGLGELARLQGDYASARAFYVEAVPIARGTDDGENMAYLIEEFAALSAAQGEVKQAVTLFGATEALREAIHIVPLPVERAEIDRNITTARAQLDEATFNAAWAEGRAMTMEQAIAYGLDNKAV